ncbi:MAG: flagellar hook capping protein [Planctomycetia bacterium]|nr:flagellar hook capping protein [Planctomycetia bacterium]
MATAAVSASTTADVSRDQFLKLLVAQLQAQDPLEPMKDQEFTAQLAQFSQLAGIEKLNANFSDLLALQQITQGAGLIGKNVTYQASDKTIHTGHVEGFSVTDGHLQLRVDGQEVPLSQFQGMTAAA